MASVLDSVEKIVQWQQEHPSQCARCGTVMDRPLNRSHYNDQIQLCDGCAVVDAIVFAPTIITKNREKTEQDYLNPIEWKALSLSEEDEALLELIDNTLDLAKSCLENGVSLDAVIQEGYDRIN